MVELSDHQWLTQEYEVHMTGLDMMVTIGHLILALKHPENRGPSALLARHITREMLGYLAHHIPPHHLQYWGFILDDWPTE